MTRLILTGQVVHWTLIYVDSEGNSPQIIRAEGADPEAAARAADDVHAWLRAYRLVAAIAGSATVLPADDARTAERGVKGWQS